MEPSTTRPLTMIIAIILAILAIVDLTHGGRWYRILLNVLILAASLLGLVGAYYSNPVYTQYFSTALVALFLLQLAYIIYLIVENVKARKFITNIISAVLLMLGAVSAYDLSKADRSFKPITDVGV